MQHTHPSPVPATPWACLFRHGLASHGSRFMRFGLVGASGVLVNMTLLFLLIEVGGWHRLVAATLATEAAILGNFVLNDRWTFREAPANHSWLGRAARYNAIALGGLVMSVAVLAALTDLLHLHYLAANLGGIGAATLWNYAANSSFTWQRDGGRTAINGVGHQAAAGPKHKPRAPGKATGEHVVLEDAL